MPLRFSGRPGLASLSQGKSDRSSACTEREENMAQTIEEFAKQCSDDTKAEPGPAGRQKSPSDLLNRGNAKARLRGLVVVGGEFVV
jgi:hypothetical protein